MNCPKCGTNMYCDAIKTITDKFAGVQWEYRKWECFDCGHVEQTAITKEIEENMYCPKCSTKMIINEWNGWKWECFHCGYIGRTATYEETKKQEREYQEWGMKAKAYNAKFLK